MPRKSIDFSKCVIYKICCKDPTITDVYVGHTTDKTNRKRRHRSRCNNENDKCYNFYVYQFIRDNGGWDNFEMIIIEEYPCENVDEARLRERYWLETLGATLNKYIPSRTRQEYVEQNREIIYEKNREYREQNREIIYEKNREYREQNKEIIREKKRKYREQNKEIIREKKREYYQKNKEILNKKIVCECGVECSKKHQLKHFKTKKHIEYLERKEE